MTTIWRRIPPRNHLHAIGSSPEFAPALFRSESHFGSGCISGDDPWHLVRAAHYFYSACGYSDGVTHADEYAPDDADAADEQLEEGCGLLVLCYCEWV